MMTEMDEDLAAATTTGMEDLPLECFNEVCSYLSVPGLNSLSQSSKTYQNLVHHGNDELWNLLLCQRLWTVDPCPLLPTPPSEDNKRSETAIDWRLTFQRLIQAEHDHQRYLDELLQLDLNGWLERHFIDDQTYWMGWERRYWSWDGNCLYAWSDDTRTHCYASFPMRRNSAVRKVTPEEQVKLGRGTRNPISPKPYVFTIENTSFDLLFACDSEAQLQLWIDKISVTLHPLKHGGTTYKAPGKYMLQRNRKRKIMAF